MMIDAYYACVTGLLAEVRDTQREPMLRAAQMVADTLAADGLIYLFGCGHSHLLGLDCFYRAGGLANVSAMLDTDLMLHNGAAKSSVMEKISGIAPSILKRYCLTPKDLLIVISTSGKNAVPVELALAARQQGIPTVGIASSDYLQDKGQTPMLQECVDLFIDNRVPHGDAVMTLPGVDVPMGSVSTAAGSFILQAVLLEGAGEAAERGVAVPVYRSGNVPGGADHNRGLVDRYLPRIKHL